MAGSAGRAGHCGMPTDLGDFIHRPAGVEAAGQCCSCVKAIALMIERAGAAAGIDVRFEHSHVEAGACQESGGS